MRLKLIVLFLLISPLILSLPTASAQDTDIAQLGIAPGGIQLFPAPDGSTGRLYAVLGDFAPYVGGVSEDGEWLYVYFFVGGEWVAGWARVSNFADVPEGFLDGLPVIDPDDPPELPELDFDPLAILPVGFSSTVVDADVSSQIFDVYDCVHTGGDVFQWDVVEVLYEDGVPVEAKILEAGVTGAWRVGCPAGEVPQTQASGGSGGGGSSSSSNDGGSGSGGSGGGYDDDGPPPTQGGT